ncbi:unnamed protein product [Rotaria magnacalcarata]|uniref:Uncharacterized protein n=2 Tax=Rotaria magnacalcarata TaxID=392030 RepID=A0A814M5M4_9BILA|nr:unnamed protein product [Rotaria magnacalcarata]CAF1568249.1 unnamed protein product [Rotaria magnacalcarata]CAF3813873.1 unnamed protein product [Rotaria magnacalcarata]CAF3995080.1 unnamed protein product [Rotaria magnacalcarata]
MFGGQGGGIGEMTSDFLINQLVPGGLNSPMGMIADNMIGGNPNNGMNYGGMGGGMNYGGMGGGYGGMGGGFEGHHHGGYHGGYGNNYGYF